MRKKILIVTENIGKTAPGIVFERLISEISNRHDTYNLCSDKELSISENEKNKFLTTNNWFTKSLLSARIIKRISKISLILLKDDWGARLTALFLKNSFNKKQELNYDFCISLVSFGHTSPIIFSENLKKSTPGIITAAYFVDAIPAPLGWSTNNKEYNGLRYFISRRIENLDAIFSSNSQMLDYQLSVAKSKTPNLKGIILNPISGQKHKLPPPPNNRYNFLYTGGIYGKRTSKHVLNAFKLILKKYPNSYLIFVGTKFQEEDFSMLTDAERTQVEVHPFAQDLTQYYSDATALIDIDAELDNDVFLSSKITNYLAVDRIIISETGKNSPARNLFSGIKSILQCQHDYLDIAQCMCHAIKNASSIDYEDRLHLVKMFSSNSVVDELEKILGIH